MKLTKLLEDLDDKDEFTNDPGCGGGCPLSDNPNIWYSQFNRGEDFHEAHETANEIARRAANDATNDVEGEGAYFNSQLWHSTYQKVAINTMKKFGYKLRPGSEPDMRKQPLENWLFAKAPVKEDLDDKDEFLGLIATGKIKTIHSYAGTEWLLIFRTPQGPTQERYIYATPKETFGRFPKHIQIEGIKFDAEVIMDMDGTIGFYADGDIREIDEQVS